MSKARRRFSVQRDASVIATRRVLDAPTVREPPMVFTNKRYPLRALDFPDADAREFYPGDTDSNEKADSRPYRRLNGRPARVVAPPLQKPRRGSASGPARAFFPIAPARLLFAAPSGVLICVRRKVRTRVLAAKRKLGRNRKGRRSAASNVRC